MRALTRIIDRIIDKQAEFFSLSIVVLVLLMCYEVVRRYFFNAPTIWGLELTTFIFGVHFIMGFCYTELYDGHVRVDIFSAKLPPKAQDLISIILNACVTLPLVALLSIWAWDNALTSTKIMERLSSAWAPPIWPVKLLMGLGFTLLFLQVLSNLIKRILRFGKQDTSA